ncbi:MAG: ClC family H(+)/Cl(-) exchange transporter [Spirochaetales bacterium]
MAYPLKTEIESILHRWEGLPWKLYARSFLVGCLGGGVVVACRLALEWVEKFQWWEILDRGYPLLQALGFLLLSLAVASLGIGWLIHRFPMIRGSGIPQVKGVLIRKLHSRWLPELLAKFSGGMIGIGSGLSLGREGPSIQLGAYVGEGIGSFSRFDGLERRYLITAGASAGLAAAFNAPLAGVIFAIEELHKSFTPRLLMCVMLGSVAGDVVSKHVFGLAPVFDFYVQSYLPVEKYPVLIGLGLLCGSVGALFNRALLFSLELHDRWIRNDLVRPLPALLVAGGLGFLLPEVLGGGEILIRSVAEGTYALQFLLVLLVVKLVFTALSYGSGSPGGIFFPLLTLGAMMGSAYVELLGDLYVGGEYRVNFVILGMTAFFSAVVKAPITGSVLLAEMVGSLQHFTSLVTISALAFLSSELLRTKPIYDVFLDRLLRRRIIAFIDGEEGERKTLLSIPVCAESELEHRKLSSLTMPDHAVLVGVVRNGVHLFPRKDLELLAGDHLSVLTMEKHAPEVKERLLRAGSPEEAP